MITVTCDDHSMSFFLYPRTGSRYMYWLIYAVLALWSIGNTTGLQLQITFCIPCHLPVFLSTTLDCPSRLRHKRWNAAQMLNKRHHAVVFIGSVLAVSLMDDQNVVHGLVSDSIPSWMFIKVPVKTSHVASLSTVSVCWALTQLSHMKKKNWWLVT